MDATEYLYEAARLRGLAHFNDIDFRLVQDGWDVRYYVDASVTLVLLIWPGRLDAEELPNRDYISHVGEQSPDDEIVEAALTGEFLFSGALHSEARRSRRDAPGEPTDTRRLILPAHSGELFNRLIEFANTHATSEANMADLKADYDEAELRLLKILDTTEAASRSIDPFGKAAQDRIAASAQIERTTILQLAMMRRFRLAGMIRLEKNLPRPEPDDLDKWRKALKKAGKEAVAADAEAIAEIEALNNAEARKQRVLHCLVTGDKRFHRGYFWQKRDEHLGREDALDEEVDLETGDFASTYYLRHPAQFLPMLNQADMPNNVRSARLFNDVVAASEAVIAQIRCSEREALYLGMLAIRDPEATRQQFRARIDGLDGVEGTVREHWSKLRQSTVLINRRMLSTRILAAARLRREVSPEDAAVQLYVDEQQRLAAELKRLDLHRAVRRGIGLLAEKLKGKGQSEDRNDLPLLVGLADLAGGKRRVFDAAQALKKGSDKGLLGRIDDKVTRLPDEDAWKGLLFCAALACYADVWSEAAWFAERARDAIEAQDETAGTARGPRLTDALWLQGYALRVRMLSGDFERSVASLGASVEAAGHADEPLRSLARARALSERATVHQFEQFRRWRDRQRQPEEVEPLPPETMLAARNDFVHALSLADGVRDGDDREKRAVDFVNRQATLNLCIFDAMSHLFPERHDELPDCVDDATLLGEIERQKLVWRTQRHEPQVTKVDRAFLNIASAYLQGERSVSVIGGLLDKLHAERDPLMKQKNTSLDRAFAEELVVCGNELADRLTRT